MNAAVDIGGTKVLIAVFDNDKIIQQIKFPTPKNYDNFKIELAKNVEKLSTKKFDHIIAAAPGKINRATGVVEAFGNLDWTNVPIKSDIESVFDQSVTIENDAKLAALSEGLLLYPAYRKALYVTISTGIGGGLVIDGKLDPDFLDIELGQMLLEYEGHLTDWEDFGSGRAFQQKFGHKVSDTEQNNHAAWYWFARNIAIGLTNLAATLTPEVIIIGGGAGAHLEKFKDRLDEQMKLYTNPMFAMPTVQEAKRPEEAVIYGCNDYAKQLD
jgi:predicted NBD/HSP70 family sugar kinase